MGSLFRIFPELTSKYVKCGLRTCWHVKITTNVDKSGLHRKIIHAISCGHTTFIVHLKPIGGCRKSTHVSVIYAFCIYVHWVGNAKHSLSFQCGLFVSVFLVNVLIIYGAVTWASRKFMKAYFKTIKGRFWITLQLSQMDATNMYHLVTFDC